jgi:hypothetical protein
MLELVSTWYSYTLPRYLLSRSQARLLSFFGKSCSDLVTSISINLCAFSAHWRFLYFHGQKHARLIRNQTVYDKPKRERSILVTCLSPLLFFAPEVHLREMEKLWTDEVIIETVWKNFMSKLLAEWEGVILWVRIQRHNRVRMAHAIVIQSTVMLAANVGFLAIPGVIISNLSGSSITEASQVLIFTSSSQIASSLSVEASIGSIVTGLLLARHNRTKQKEDPSEAVSRQSYLTCLSNQHLDSRDISTGFLIQSTVSNRWLLFSVFRGRYLCGRTSSRVYSSVHVHETSSLWTGW